MIIVYSKMRCSWCERAKQFLTAKGYTWKENQIGRDIELDEFKEIFPDAKSVPQIVELVTDGVNKIGGYDDLLKWHATKELSI